MINDSIQFLNRYNVPRADSILRFIKENDCLNLPDGEIEIEGRDLFVRVMSYFPKPAAENKFETHHTYADLQYVVTGAEMMQIARLDDLTVLTEYDAKGDYQFFKIEVPTTGVIVQSGEFTVFYPKEAHRPACAYEGYKGIVKKMVFKIRICSWQAD